MSLTLDRRLPRARRLSLRLPRALWQGLARAWIQAGRRAALRRELDRMDAHMLSDIGVSRAQLRFELDEAGRRGR